ncbi:WD40 repeat domain-containing protein [Persicitalea sp.]|uniref:WD40 repeat domain-containing protein n=1 Tax=Persicitalea sp. TaxID=3100273 RepID=UPI0035932EF2
MLKSLFLLLLLPALALAQEDIYHPDVPELFTVWHRVADFAPAMRAVEAARISPDGRTAVSVSKFGPAVRVWRVADGALLWEKDQNAEVECAAFSPDGKRFVTGDEDYFVKIWDAQTGRELKKIEVNSSLDGITWSHDGKQIAAGSENGDLLLWDANTFKPMGTLNVGSTINSLDFTSDDNRIVVGGNIQTPNPQTKKTDYFGFARLIDLSGTSPKVIRTYEGPKGSVKSIRISNDQKFVATGGFDNGARVFELETGKMVYEFIEPERIEAVAFTGDGNFLVTGGHQHVMTFYRLRDGKKVLEQPSPRTEYLDFSADGRLLLSAHEDSGLISLYLMQSNMQHRQELYHQLEVKYLRNRDLKAEKK